MSELVSICIPNYNMDRFVRETIESALNQRYADIEVVVVDNDSTDSSWSIIESYSGDARFRCYRNDGNIGMVRNWNRCLEYSKGYYVILLSADDILEPVFVEECMALFKDFDNVGYVATECNRIDETGAVMDYTDFYRCSGVIKGKEEARLNIIGCHTNPSQILIRRSFLEGIGGFDERYGWAFDIDAMMKLNLVSDVGYIKKRLCRYRIHSGMSSSYYFRSKLGIMEKYRVKMNLLDNLPPGMEDLENYRGEMIKGLARTCLCYSERALMEKDYTLAREYLDLACSFSGEIRSDLRYTLISFFIANKDRLPVEDYAEIGEVIAARRKEYAEGPPYDLPEGSVLLEVHGEGV